MDVGLWTLDFGLWTLGVGLVSSEAIKLSILGANGENSEVVKTINTLANNLGMSVVAEGIETEEQLAQLKAMGCGFGQGYIFSRPLMAEAATLFVQEHQAFAVSNLIDDSRVQSQLQMVN